MTELAYFLAFFAGLFLLVAAAAWWRVARERSRGATVSQARLRLAASASAIALSLLGVVVLLVVVERAG